MFGSERRVRESLFSVFGSHDARTENRTRERKERSPLTYPFAVKARRSQRAEPWQRDAAFPSNGWHWQRAARRDPTRRGNGAAPLHPRALRGTAAPPLGSPVTGVNERSSAASASILPSGPQEPAAACLTAYSWHGPRLLLFSSFFERTSGTERKALQRADARSYSADDGLACSTWPEAHRAPPPVDRPACSGRPRTCAQQQADGPASSGSIAAQQFQLLSIPFDCLQLLQTPFNPFQLLPTPFNWIAVHHFQAFSRC